MVHRKIGLLLTLALVLSSCAGLWSYVLGDTLELVTLDPPRLRVTAWPVPHRDELSSRKGAVRCRCRDQRVRNEMPVWPTGAKSERSRARLNGLL